MGSCFYSDFTWGFVWTLEPQFPLDSFQRLQAWLFSRHPQNQSERPWSGLELDFRFDLVVCSKQNIKGKNMVPNEWMCVCVCLSDASLSLPKSTTSLFLFLSYIFIHTLAYTLFLFICLFLLLIIIINILLYYCDIVSNNNNNS